MLLHGLAVAIALNGDLNQRDPLPRLPEGATGIAARFPGDRGIEGDRSVIFHDDFETGKPQGWRMVFQPEWVSVTSERINVHSGSHAIEMMLPKAAGEHSDAAMKEFEGQDTVFLRFYGQYDPEFAQVGSSHNGGYLAAIAPGVPYSTPGIKADGKNKFAASFECWRGDLATPSPGRLNVYCYHPGQRSPYGDHFFPNGEVMPNTSLHGDFGPDFVPRPHLTPALGKWICYELMVHANTPGKRDGRIACWVDGKLVADFPNLSLRDSADLKINHASIDFHIGNNEIRTNRKWYDDVVIATSYIGPMSGRG